jgi:hypothetical protein
LDCGENCTLQITNWIDHESFRTEWTIWRDDNEYFYRQPNGFWILRSQISDLWNVFASSHEDFLRQYRLMLDVILSSRTNFLSFGQQLIPSQLFNHYYFVEIQSFWLHNPNFFLSFPDLEWLIRMLSILHIVYFRHLKILSFSFMVKKALNYWIV